MHADDLDALRMAAVHVPPARELDHRLVRFGAAVAEEDAVGEAQPGQFLGQAHLRLGEVEIRRVPEELRLLEHCIAHLRIRVPYRDGGDAADEVEVPLAVRVPHLRPFAAHQRDGLRPVVLEEHLLRAVGQLANCA